MPVDILQILKPEQIRLGIGGFYPSRIKRTLPVNLLTAFIYVLTFGHITLVVNYALSTDDMAKVSEIFLLSMTQISFVNKLINFQSKYCKLAELDKTLEQDVFTNVTPKEQNIFSKTIASGQRALWFFYGICTIGVSVYGLAPLMDNAATGRKNYPFPAKFPFNPDDYYVIIYMTEVIVLVISAWINASK